MGALHELAACNRSNLLKLKCLNVHWNNFFYYFVVKCCEPGYICLLSLRQMNYIETNDTSKYKRVPVSVHAARIEMCIFVFGKHRLLTKSERTDHRKAIAVKHNVLRPLDKQL